MLSIFPSIALYTLSFASSIVLPEAHTAKSLDVPIDIYLFSPVNNGTAEQKIEKLPYTCAEIGLKIPKPDMKSFNYSFIRNLKLSNAIKTYNFFIEYNEENDDEGEIIIGIEPHNYNKKKYKEDKLVELYSEQFN